jgi:uncharacterized protein (DUF1015 family)
MTIAPFYALYAHLPEGIDPETFLRTAKEGFCTARQAGYYQVASRPAIGVYQIDTGRRTHTGLLALNQTGDADEGRIRPHEQTLRAKEIQQLDLFLTWEAVIKPLLLTFSPVMALSEWLRSVTTQSSPAEVLILPEAGQTHRIWWVDDPIAIAQVQQIMFHQATRAYVADGHHRLAAMQLLRREPERSPRPVNTDWLLCAYFDSTQLNILEYNRLVKHSLDTETLLARLAPLFGIERLAAPQKPHLRGNMSMYTDRTWYDLRWKNTWPAPDGLPMTTHELFNKYVLPTVFGIDNIREDQRVTYADAEQGLPGLQQAADAASGMAGFALPPVAFADFRAHADAGRMLPPKSTWFWPRLPTGLVAQLLTFSDQFPATAHPDTHRP